MRTATLFRVRITVKGVEKPTKFYTGTPHVFYLPKYFGRGAEAAAAAEQAAKRIAATYPPGTRVLKAEAVEVTVEIPKLVKR